MVWWIVADGRRIIDGRYSGSRSLTEWFVGGCELMKGS